MSDTLYTIKELSEKTKVPENTIRRYVETFKDFIRSDTQGNKKKYSAQTVEIIKKVYPLYQSGKNTEEIYTILQHDYTPVIEVKQDIPEADNETLPALITQQAFAELIKRNNELTQQNVEALRTISEVLTRVLDQGEEIAALKEQIRELQHERKPFLKRLFNRD